MVQGLSCVVEYRPGRILDNGFKVAILERCTHDQLIQVVDIGFKMFAMMQFYRGFADNGSQGICFIG